MDAGSACWPPVALAVPRPACARLSGAVMWAYTRGPGLWATPEDAWLGVPLPTGWAVLPVLGGQAPGAGP